MIQRLKNRTMRFNQKGITGLETAIIFIAFVVVAAVFAYTTLSAGLFTAGKGNEAVYSGLEKAQGTLELKGKILCYKDTLNAGGNGSVGKINLTVATSSEGAGIDLTPAYTLDASTGALTESNPGGNRIQVAFIDSAIKIDDCAWTIAWVAQNNGDNMLVPGEKVVLTVWLHTFDGANWGPAENESTPFLTTNYVDTYHTFNLEVKSNQGASLSLQRTTPAFLFNIVDLK